jgi:1-deoxy-D-xylulose-5-phosphate reductoisomerase
VVILGCTGSIGRQALQVAEAHRHRIRIVGLVAGRDETTLASQAEKHGVERFALGPRAAEEMAALEDADVVLNAIVGAAGLRASVAALSSGKVLALANKESLVAGGELCLAAARAGGGRIVPVDSEHAAIAQCLEGRDPSQVERLVLTASGGPFRTRSDLSSVTPRQALAHPTWSMGPKITIDSATLMNKGLEVIEAHFLFGFGYERIGVVVHPQSTVHGMIELVDGTTVMQAAPPDMRIPIQWSLTAPDRIESMVRPVDLVSAGRLEFEAVDPERFPAVDLAYEAGRKGDTFPAALNAANEVAVAAFLAERLPFTAIAEVVSDVLARHEPLDPRELDAVLEADHRARAAAEKIVSGMEAAP